MRKFLSFITVLFLTGVVFGQNDLIISEYVEGSSQNKAVELYNPTDNAIDLSEYTIKLYKNGNTAPDRETALSGTIQAHSTFVIVNNVAEDVGYGATSQELLNKADLLVPGVYETSAIYWNGNDAIALFKGSQPVDLFGKIGMGGVFDIDGEDNGWTNVTDTTVQYGQESYTIVDYNAGPLYWLSWSKDHTLIRKPNVRTGVTTNPAAFNVGLEWDSLGVDYFDNLGTHDIWPESIEEVSVKENFLTVYPNPISGKGVLNISSEKELVKVVVYNLLGTMVYEQEFETVSFCEINTTGFDSGIYFIKAYTEGAYSLKKVIVN